MPNYDRMVWRQKLLADFGEFALRSEELDEVLTEACRLVQEALATDFAKIMEIRHETRTLLVRSGIGWKPGIVGQLELPMSHRCSETFAIAQAQPVITRDVKKEERFEFPAFIREHGITAIVNVPVFLPGGQPYGLIQADCREPRDFGPEDIEFLRTYATILGPVIDRLRKVHDLEIALEANQCLLAELQHRVKNHLGIIASLVQLRRREVKGDEARQELAGIGERVETLRLVHEQLYLGGRAEDLRLRPYITELVGRLCGAHAAHSEPVILRLDIEDLRLTPDLAVPLGLILNEFVTNSLKYAFADGRTGTIAVDVTSMPQGRLFVRMSDDGAGLPVEPRASGPGSGTGMRIIDGLARQIRAELAWSSVGGVALSLDFPSLQG